MSKRNVVCSKPNNRFNCLDRTEKTKAGTKIKRLSKWSVVDFFFVFFSIFFLGFVSLLIEIFTRRSEKVHNFFSSSLFDLLRAIHYLIFFLVFITLAVVNTKFCGPTILNGYWLLFLIRCSFRFVLLFFRFFLNAKYCGLNL